MTSEQIEEDKIGYQMISVAIVYPFIFSHVGWLVWEVNAMIKLDELKLIKMKLCLI